MTITEITNKIIRGDSLEVLKTFPDESIDCVVTSPPYWALRDYQIDGQLGMEATFTEYLDKLIEIFKEIKRVLKDDGSIWINLGDTYNGNKKGKTDKKVNDYLKEHSNGINKKKDKKIKPKSLCQIPSRFSIRMTDELEFILRNEINWWKTNAMPSSAKDRFTIDFEKIFFFTKQRKYYFEQQFEPHKTEENRPDGIIRNRIYKYNSKLNKMRGFKAKENNIGQSPQHHRSSINYGKRGRNKRTTWSIPTKPFKAAHFAVYPEQLVETPILAGCPEGGLVLDPFMGAGTTAVVARKLGRNYVGIELNPEYIEIAEKRLKDESKQLDIFLNKNSKLSRKT